MREPASSRHDTPHFLSPPHPIALFVRPLRPQPSRSHHEPEHTAASSDLCNLPLYPTYVKIILPFLTFLPTRRKRAIDTSLPIQIPLVNIIFPILSDYPQITGSHKGPIALHHCRRQADRTWRIARSPCPGLTDRIEHNLLKLKEIQPPPCRSVRESGQVGPRWAERRSEEQHRLVEGEGLAT